MYNIFSKYKLYKDSDLLQHDTVTVHEWLQTFKKNVLPSTSKVKVHESATFL